MVALLPQHRKGSLVFFALLFHSLLSLQCSAPTPEQDPRFLIPVPLRWQGERNPLEVRFCEGWEKGKGIFQFPETFRSPCAALDGSISPYTSLLVPLQEGESVTAAFVLAPSGTTFPVEVVPFLAANYQPFVELAPLVPLPVGSTVTFRISGILKNRPFGRCLGTCTPHPDFRALAFAATIPDEVTPFFTLVGEVPPARVVTAKELPSSLPRGKALSVRFQLLDYRLPDEEGGTIAPEAAHPVTMDALVFLPLLEPPRGWVVFVHGLGGTPWMFLRYYQKLVERGYGALGIPQLRHKGRHDVKGVGFQVDIVNSYMNLANLGMMRDNFREMILDIRQAILALPELHRHLMLPPPNTVSVGYVGESLGCLVGGGAYGMIPEIKRAACLVGGGRLYRLLMDSSAGGLFGSVEVPLGGYLRGREWTPFLRAIGPRTLDAGDPAVLALWGTEHLPGRIFRLYLAHLEALMPNSASLDLIRALSLPRLGPAPPPWNQFPEGDPGGSGFRVGVYLNLLPPDRHGAVKDDPFFQEDILALVTLP